MKIAMNAVFVDPQGEAVVNDQGPVTLGFLCAEVLLGGEWQNAPADEKGKRFDLWMKIRGKEEVDLDSKEIDHLQTLVGEAAAPLIMGQARELLEGRENPLRVTNGRKKSTNAGEGKESTGTDK